MPSFKFLSCIVAEISWETTNKHLYTYGWTALQYLPAFCKAGDDYWKDQYDKFYLPAEFFWKWNTNAGVIALDCSFGCWRKTTFSFDFSEIGIEVNDCEEEVSEDEHEEGKHGKEK